MNPAAAAQPGFTPDLLVGCLYEFPTGELEFSKSRRAGQAAIEAVETFVDNHKHGQLKGYLPAACSRGLVSLRRRPSPPPPTTDHGGFVPSSSEITVCNPMTAQFHGFLPHPAIHDESHVLLPAAAEGTGSFRLHVVNLELVPHAGVLQIQTFSSAAGNWGPVVATYARLPLGSPCRFLRPTPLVLNGSVAYWLCVSGPAQDSASGSDNNKQPECHVLALPLDGARQPGPIGLPAQLLQRRGGFKPNREKLLLAATPGPRRDRLTLVSVKGLKMTMWALLDDDDEEEGGQGETTSRWTRLPGVDVGRSLARFHDIPELTREDTVSLECFAERSRAVLFRLYHGTLFKVDLDTMEAFFLGIYSKQADTELCPYESGRGENSMDCCADAHG